MNELFLKEQSPFLGKSENLVERLEVQAVRIAIPEAYTNTQAPMINFIRGSIEYFEELPSDFLGASTPEDNATPEADHFANTFYRLANSMQTLSQLWGSTYKISTEFKWLNDIRTLIVHSGENINPISLPNTNEYRDNQLWRILQNTERSHSWYFDNSASDADYCIIMSSDKHDRQAVQHRAEVDYKANNDDNLDQWIYLWASSIRNIVLCEVEHFLDALEGVSLPDGPSHQLNKEILEHIIDFDNYRIDFSKVFTLTKKDRRSGVLVERGEVHWYGFGMQKLLEYVNLNNEVSVQVKTVIFERFVEVLTLFWKEYPNDDIPFNDIVSLDIRQIFKSYLPYFEMKQYLEGEKLFIYIAPEFNTPCEDYRTDLDYLGMFITAISDATGESFTYDGNVDDLVCKYFCKSIENHLKIM
ncbi:hypothetical protein LFYK43_13030 [Ligilactobacillus salitolerans]|uniref:Uncharacterized protein n=1 Tax=Ligilactobacillus salitolerans TaxID=1808352 RepID=A0A401ITJ3_9LACO|nr:hypothetical protein [Ligilactobacillus salitolerans]GBG94844.1 hypothetical protein LFYK43_13030 [Ligilactobacillus salitolerans]